MDIKTILKSFALGSLLALVAIIAEFLFIFNEDDIIEMYPGPIRLFIWHLVLFFGVALFLLLQFRLVSDNMQKKFDTDILLQIILLIIYFLFIIIRPLWLSGLAAISAVFITISIAKGILQTNKKYLLQAGVYIFIAFLCLLVTRTEYIIVE